MSDLIALAVQQLQAVERELAALKSRADELRAFISTGRQLAQNVTNATICATESPDTTAVHGDVTVSLVGLTMRAIAGSVVPAVQESIKTRAIRAAEAALRVSQPQTAPQLLQELYRMGTVIGGKKPAANLAAILSQSPKFRNERGHGYVLNEPRKTEPVDAETSAGSAWFDPSNAPGKGTATAAD